MKFDILVRHLLFEDATSQERAAINILKKNRVVNWEDILRELKEMTEPYSTNRGAKNNGHLPDLVKLYINSGYNMERLKREYQVYMSVPKLNTKPLSRFNGIYLNFIGEVHSVNTSVNIQKGNNISIGGDNSDVVYTDDKITVYLANSMDKCIKYGKGDRYGLCISDENKKLNAYMDYRPYMTTYFVYFKNIDPSRIPGCGFIIVDRCSSEEFKRTTKEYSYNPVTDLRGKAINKDRGCTSEELIKMYPELQKAFKKDIFKFCRLSLSELIEVGVDLSSILDTIPPDQIKKDKEGKEKLLECMKKSWNSSAVIYYAENLPEIYNREEIRKILLALINGSFYRLAGNGNSKIIDFLETYDLEEEFMNIMNHEPLSVKYGHIRNGKHINIFKKYDIVGRDKETWDRILKKDISIPHSDLSNLNLYLNAFVYAVNDEDREKLVKLIIQALLFRANTETGCRRLINIMKKLAQFANMDKLFEMLQKEKPEIFDSQYSNRFNYELHDILINYPIYATEEKVIPTWRYDEDNDDMSTIDTSTNTSIIDVFAKEQLRIIAEYIPCNGMLKLFAKHLYISAKHNTINSTRINQVTKDNIQSAISENIVTQNMPEDD